MSRYLILLILFSACRGQQMISLPARPANALSGSAFYQQAIPLTREEREVIALKEILAGNVPSFLKKFSRVNVSITDYAGNKIHGEIYVSPDYLSIGNDNDFARIPLTPMTAQKIADSLDCFLPTRKMVNDIYAQAAVKLEPVPLLSHRDSALIFYHHHLIIEGQRKDRKGLIAGIKKDVVMTSILKKDRVNIYGWHKLDGNAIQPMYSGHVNWYVDYSHGIRLVYRKLKVNGKWMDYLQVLDHPRYKVLFCDEETNCLCHYPY